MVGRWTIDQEDCSGWEGVPTELRQPSQLFTDSLSSTFMLHLHDVEARLAAVLIRVGSEHWGGKIAPINAA